MSDKELSELLLERVKKNGVATVQVKDGMIVMLSLEKLQSLVTLAEHSGENKVVLFIQEPKVLN